jgi:hypothetical protein
MFGARDAGPLLRRRRDLALVGLRATSPAYRANRFVLCSRNCGEALLLERADGERGMAQEPVSSSRSSTRTRSWAEWITRAASSAFIARIGKNP